MTILRSELEDLLRDEPWPRLSFGSMSNWLPHGVISGYATEVATMLWSGVRIEREDAPAVIVALRKAGIDCKYDARLKELFSAWE